MVYHSITLSFCSSDHQSNPLADLFIRSFSFFILFIHSFIYQIHLHVREVNDKILILYLCLHVREVLIILTLYPFPCPYIRYKYGCSVDIIKFRINYSWNIVYTPGSYAYIKWQIQQIIYKEITMNQKFPSVMLNYSLIQYKYIRDTCLHSSRIKLVSLIGAAFGFIIYTMLLKLKQNSQLKIWSILSWIFTDQIILCF